MRCITKENIIDRPSLNIIQLLPFLQNKASTHSTFSSYAL
jgi:hypothetical protein